MGYFTIALPAERKGEVRFGRIMQKSINLRQLFRKRRNENSVRKGYIITIDPAAGDKKVYYLLRSDKGDWLQEDHGGFRVSADDEISVAIKKAIDEYEDQKSNNLRS